MIAAKRRAIDSGTIEKPVKFVHQEIEIFLLALGENLWKRFPSHSPRKTSARRRQSKALNLGLKNPRRLRRPAPQELP